MPGLWPDPGIQLPGWLPLPGSVPPTLGPVEPDGPSVSTGEGEDPEDYRLPWYGPTEETPENHWPWGVFEGQNDQWYKRFPGGFTQKVPMPNWAKISKDIDARAYKGPASPYDGNLLPAEIRFQLDEINDMQNAAMSARDTLQSEIEARTLNVQIGDGKGGYRSVTSDDFTDSNLKNTLSELSDSGQLQPEEIVKLRELATELIDEKASISSLSEVRGQVGGDYVSTELNIETIYQGSGNYDTDRLGIQTLPDGTQRIVLVEEKGGLRPTYGTRGVDVGGSKKLNAQQGSVAYGVDEFRTGSAALQALVDYDAEHGTTFAKDLVEGRIDFGYLGVHVEPGANTITVVEFVPEPGMAFNLQHPGTGQRPPALLLPTQSTQAGEIGSTGPPVSGLGPIADAGIQGLASPMAPWLSSVLASAAPWLAGLTSHAEPHRIPLVAPQSSFSRRDLSRPADQSMTVNLIMQPMVIMNAVHEEAAHWYTYASSIR
ncbi:hypothetical protein ACWDYH_13325 [Nocardia goodfellowii]